MKRFTALMMAAVCALSFAGCSDNSGAKAGEVKVISVEEAGNISEAPYFCDDSILFEGADKLYAVNTQDGSLNEVDKDVYGRVVSDDKNFYWVDKRGENMFYLMSTSKETGASTEETVIGNMISSVYKSENFIFWAEKTNDAYNIKRFNLDTKSKDNLTAVPLDNDSVKTVWAAHNGFVTTGYTDYTIKTNCVTVENAAEEAAVKHTLDVAETPVTVISDGKNIFWGTSKGLYMRDMSASSDVKLAEASTKYMNILNGKTLVYVTNEGAFTCNMDSKEIKAIDFGNENLVLSDNTFYVNDAKTEAVFVLADKENADAKSLAVVKF